MIDARAETRMTRWTWIAAIWCAGALFYASQTMLVMHALGGRSPWLLPFVIEFTSWLPWALATPLVIELARRRPVVQGPVLKSATVHLAAFAAISTTAEAWSAA